MVLSSIMKSHALPARMRTLPVWCIHIHQSLSSHLHYQDHCHRTEVPMFKEQFYLIMAPKHKGGDADNLDIIIPIL